MRWTLVWSSLVFLHVASYSPVGKTGFLLWWSQVNVPQGEHGSSMHPNDKGPKLAQSHFCHILLDKTSHKSNPDSKGQKRSFYPWLGGMSMPHCKELYVLELEVFAPSRPQVLSPLIQRIVSKFSLDKAFSLTPFLNTCPYKLSSFQRPQQVPSL